jgi:hypothetical protein
VILNWVTASEVNNSGFEIERKINNSTWENTGFIPGNGTTTETRAYTFSDNNLKPGIYYYRLKQVDHDGSYLNTALACSSA